MDENRRNSGKMRKKNKEEKKWIEKVIGNRELITIIVSACTALYPIMNYIYKIVYQNQCETFYGIPGKYFDYNMANKILYLICIIILIVGSVIPLIIIKQDEKRNNVTKGTLVEATFLAIIIGIELGAFNVYNLIEIMSQAYKVNGSLGRIVNYLDEHACMTVTVVIIFVLVTVLGITFNDKIRTINKKWIKNVISAIVIFSLSISILIMIYGTVFKFTISIKDKRYYEVVTYDQEEYVVLSSYQDKLLVVPFTISQSEKYVFKTSEYFFKDQYDATYRYVNVKYEPKIEKQIIDIVTKNYIYFI